MLLYVRNNARAEESRSILNFNLSNDKEEIVIIEEEMVNTEDSTQKTQICDDDTNLIHLPHDPHLVTSDPPTITITYRVGGCLSRPHTQIKEFNHTGKTINRIDDKFDYLTVVTKCLLGSASITEDSVHVIKARMDYLATYTQSLAWSTSKRLSNIEDSQAVMASDLSVMKTNIKTSF
ncbi:hypothetical protein Tco_0200111 [Tanacetum coccineum]